MAAASEAAHQPCQAPCPDKRNRARARQKGERRGGDDASLSGYGAEDLQNDHQRKHDAHNAKLRPNLNRGIVRMPDAQKLAVFGRDLPGHGRPIHHGADAEARSQNGILPDGVAEAEPDVDAIAGVVVGKSLVHGGRNRVCRRSGRGTAQARKSR